MNWIWTRGYTLGLVLALVFSWVAYRQSERISSGMRAMFRSNVEVRALMKTNAIVNQALATFPHAFALNDPSIYQKGLNLLRLALSEQGDASPYRDLLQTLIRHLEQGQSTMSYAAFSKEAIAMEDISAALYQDEETRWGRFLNEHNELLDQQKESHRLLLWSYALVCLFLFWMMLLAFRYDKQGRQLKQGQAFYLGLLQSLSEAVFLCDRRGRIVFANDQCERLTGVTSVDVVGKSVFDLFFCTLREDGTVYPQHESPIFFSLKHGDAISNVVMGLSERAWGQRWFSVNTRPIEKTDGDSDRMIVSMIDITDRIRAERTVAQQRDTVYTSAKLSALGMMAGGIAHEINNPLSIIQSEAEDLGDLAIERKSVESAQVATIANTIGETVTRITRIMKGLKRFSREGGHDPFETVRLQALIDDLLLVCEARCRQQTIAIQTVLDPPELEWECRPVQISQVLLNLVSNAVDAIASLPERWIRIDACVDRGRVLIRVTDSGKGISPDVLPKLFAPFFTTKEAGRGTGLGLPISRGIARDHGGDLTVDTSSPHTCFVLTIPRHQIKAAG